MNPKILQADRGLSVADIQNSEVLDVRNVDARAWELLTAHCSAPELRLYHLLVRSLDGIEKLHNTSSLQIIWANKFADLSPLFRLVWLERLELSDLPLLRALDGIQTLEKLRALNLSGNCGSLHPPLRLASLKPLAELKSLSKLSIFNVRLQDDEISFIASAFPDLQEFELWNTNVEFAQIAFIAKALNHQLAKPITAGQRLNVPCTECGGSLFRFNGYRMPTVCELCDRSQFQRLLDRFDHPETSNSPRT